MTRRVWASPRFLAIHGLAVLLHVRSPFKDFL